MVWDELTEQPRGRLGRAGRARRRRPADPGRRRDGAPARRRRPARGRTPPERRPACRGSAASRSSSASSSRRSRSSPLDGEMRGILLGAAVATTVGAIDDFRGLRWWEKLGGQVARRRRSRAGSASGSTASRSRSSASHELPQRVGIALTVVGIVAVMNMVNFLDGLDGLAAGVCAISALLVLRDRRCRSGQPDAAILTAIVFGACLGFLRHNFYPARIFMGDSGALLLGFTLAPVSVQGLLEDGRADVARPAAARARRAAARHLVRRREAASSTASPSTSPTARTCTTASRTSASRSAARSLYLYGWCADPGARRARDALRPPASATATGTRSNVAIDAASALLALGASVYVVYLLEIVKLANPFIRRREEQARAREPQDRLTLRARVVHVARTGYKVAPFALNQATLRCRHVHELRAARSAMLRADGARRAPRVSACRGGRPAHRRDARSWSAWARSSAGPPVSLKGGLIVGAVLGVPAGVVGVYRRYRGVLLLMPDAARNPRPVPQRPRSRRRRTRSWSCSRCRCSSIAGWRARRVGPRRRRSGPASRASADCWRAPARDG